MHRAHRRSGQITGLQDVVGTRQAVTDESRLPLTTTSPPALRAWIPMFSAVTLGPGIERGSGHIARDRYVVDRFSQPWTLPVPKDWA